MIPLLCYCRIEPVLRKRLKETIDHQSLIDTILKYQNLHEHLIRFLGTSHSSL